MTGGIAETQIRCVTHRHVGEAEIDRAIEAVKTTWRAFR